jgi:Trk K+ transport system NAD-binding subunit
VQNHVIVCGLGQVGYRVVDLLLRLGEQVAVITLESRPHWLRDVQERGAVVIVGDARDDSTLMQANVVGAHALIACADQDLVNLEVSLDARKISPTIRIVARLFDQNLARRLEESLGIDRALAMSVLASPAFAAAAFGDEVLGAFQIEGRPFLVGRFDVDENSRLAGMSQSQLAHKFNLSTLLHLHPRTVEEEEIRVGDRIKLVGENTALGQVAPSYLAVRALQSKSKALVKLGRVFNPRHGIDLIIQVWRNMSLPLRSAVVLMTVLTLLSVAVFSLGMRISALDAFYFVISTVTTTGYGDITPVKEAPWLKLYGSMLMLLGSAGFALLYSIMTDYIVTNRFQQLVGKQKIPEDDHVIVVGLGNVGYRTVAELERMDARVVAVEANPNSDLLGNVKLKTPVIIGDAREADTLERAGIEHATAVIALTSSDAVNLSVGLLAHHMNPKVKTVIRTFDADLAHKVQQSLEIDVAMSASRLAAPTFVGAALYPDVVAAYEAQGRLFILCSSPAEEGWVGRKAKDLHHVRGDRVLFRIDRKGEPLAVHPEMGEVQADDSLLTVIERDLN